MGFDNHCEVGVVGLWHVLLVFAQLDRHNVSKVGTRVIPEEEGNDNRILKGNKRENKPGSSHEAENKSLLRPGHFVGGPEHLLGLQHLVLRQ